VYETVPDQLGVGPKNEELLYPNFETNKNPNFGADFTFVYIPQPYIPQVRLYI